MRHIRTAAKRTLFKILATTRSAQAAMMVLKPGQASGPPGNEHPRSEQWLYVASGRGRALVNRRRISIGAGSLLLIEKGELHQVVNSTRKELITINLYAPPAYDSQGDPR